MCPSMSVQFIPENKELPPTTHPGSSMQTDGDEDGWLEGSTEGPDEGCWEEGVDEGFELGLDVLPLPLPFFLVIFEGS